MQPLPSARGNAPCSYGIRFGLSPMMRHVYSCDIRSSMHVTIKRPFVPSGPRFRNTLSDPRLRRPRVIRKACCRPARGAEAKLLRAAPRAYPMGQGSHTWLRPSGVPRAAVLHEPRPDGKSVFGRRRGLIERSQDRITERGWKEERLWLLAIEGHARSAGRQGGNDSATLDAGYKPLVVNGLDITDPELKPRLSGQSHSCRRRLGAQQVRREALRDVPFSVAIGGGDIRNRRNARVPDTPGSKPTRVSSSNLDPGRLGWTAVEDAQELMALCIEPPCRHLRARLPFQTISAQQRPNDAGKSHPASSILGLLAVHFPNAAFVS